MSIYTGIVYSPWVHVVEKYVSNPCFYSRGDLLQLRGNVKPTFTSTFMANGGNCIEFDGVDRGPNTSHLRSLGIEAGVTGEFTFEMWLNLSSTGGQSGIITLGGQWGETVDKQSYLLQIVSGQLKGTVRDKNQNFIEVYGGFITGVGSTTHAALIYTGKAIRVGVFGSRSSPVTLTGVQEVQNEPLIIGKHAAHGLFHGKVDEIRITKTGRYRNNYPTNQALTYADGESGVSHIYHCESSFFTTGKKIMEGNTTSGNSSTVCTFGTSSATGWCRVRPLENNTIAFFDPAEPPFENDKSWYIDFENFNGPSRKVSRVIPAGTWTFHNVLTNNIANANPDFILRVYVGKFGDGFVSELFRAESGPIVVSNASTSVTFTKEADEIEIGYNETLAIAYWIAGKGGGGLNQAITFRLGTVAGFQDIDFEVPGQIKQKYSIQFPYEHFKRTDDFPNQLVAWTRIASTGYTTDSGPNQITGHVVPIRGKPVLIPPFHTGHTGSFLFTTGDGTTPGGVMVNLSGILSSNTADPFTVELRCKPYDYNHSDQTMIGIWGNSNADRMFELYLFALSNNTAVTYMTPNFGQGGGGFGSPGFVGPGESAHICMQYSGGQRFFVYKNGALIGQIATTGFNKPANPILWIGNLGGTSQPFGGEIDEVRFSNIVRYPTGGFTPSVKPFPSDANTVFLYHFDNVIEKLPKVLVKKPKATMQGLPVRQKLSSLKREFRGGWLWTGAAPNRTGWHYGGEPIVVSTAGSWPLGQTFDLMWDTSFDGGVGEGSRSNAKHKQGHGSIGIKVQGDTRVTGSFTFEYKVIFKQTGRFQLMGRWKDDDASRANFYLGITDTNAFRAAILNSSNSVITASSAANLVKLNTPYDLAMVYDRNANTLRLFISGVQRATATSSTFKVTTVDEPLWIGRIAFIDDDPESPYTISGHLGEVRLSNIARYTSAGYTPANNPFLPDANTLALFHLDGNDVFQRGAFCKPTNASLTDLRNYFRTLTRTAQGIIPFNIRKLLIKVPQLVLMRGNPFITKFLNLKRRLTVVARGVPFITKFLSLRRTLTRTGRGIPFLTRRLTLFRSFALMVGRGLPIFNRKLTLFKTIKPNTLVGFPTLTKLRLFRRTLLVVLRGIPTISRRLTLFRTLVRTARGNPTLTRIAFRFKTLTTLARGISTLTRRLTLFRTLKPNTLRGIIINQPRVVFKTILKTARGIPTITKRLTLFRTLFRVMRGMNVGLTKVFRREILFFNVFRGGVSLRRQMRKTLLATARCIPFRQKKHFIDLSFGPDILRWTPDSSSYANHGMLSGLGGFGVFQQRPLLMEYRQSGTHKAQFVSGFYISGTGGAYEADRVRLPGIRCTGYTDMWIKSGFTLEYTWSGYWGGNMTGARSACGQWGHNDSGKSFAVGFVPIGDFAPGAVGMVMLRLKSDPTVYQQQYISTHLWPYTEFPYEGPHQIALVWSGASGAIENHWMGLYINGKLVSNVSIGTGWDLNLPDTKPTPFWIGKTEHYLGSFIGGGGFGYSGYEQIGYNDEIRFSNIPRYTSDAYNADVAPFNVDSNTIGLWHCNQDFVDGGKVKAIGVTPKVEKKLLKTFFRVLRGIPTLTRRIVILRRTLTRTARGIVTLTRRLTLFRTLKPNTLRGLPTLTKFLNLKRTLSRVARGLPVFTRRIVNMFRTLSVDMIGLPTLRKMWIRTMTFLARGIPTLTRRLTLFRTLLVILRGIPTLTRRLILFRTLTTLLRGIPFLTKIRLFKRTLFVIARGIPTLTRRLTLFRLLKPNTLFGIPTLTKLRLFKRTLTTVMRGIPFLTRIIDLFRTLSRTAQGISTITKRLTLFRTLSRTARGLPILNRRLILFRTLSGVVRGISTLARLLILKRSRLVVGVGLPILTRLLQLFRTLTRTARGNPTLIKLAIRYRTLFVVARGLPILVRKLTLFRSLVRVARGIPTLIRRWFAFRTLTTMARGIPTLTRRLLLIRVRLVVMRGIAVLNRRLTLFRTIRPNTLRGIPTLARVALFKRLLLVVARGVPTLTRRLTLYRTLFVIARGNPTLIKVSKRFRTLIVLARGIPTLTRRLTLFRNLTRTMRGLPVFTRRLVLFRTLTRTARGIPTLTRLIYYLRTLTATIRGVPTLNRTLSLFRLIRAINIFNTGLFFGGIDGKVTGASTSLETNVTIECWVKFTSTNQRPMVSNRNGSGNVYFGLTGGKFFVYVSGATPNPGIQSTVNINDGNWHHVAWTNDGTTSKLYIDGVLDSTHNHVRGTSTGVLHIGYDQANNEYLNGTLDEVRVWKTDKTADEIKYNHVRELTGSESNLLRYYKFNEGSGTTANDSSAAASHGTLSGDVIYTSTGAILGGPARGIVVIRKKMFDTFMAVARGIPTFNRKLTLFRRLAVIMRGLPTLTRRLSLFRTLMRTARGVAVLNRRLTLYRRFTTLFRGNPIARLRVPFEELPGRQVIRKIIRIIEE
jgi:hypothetical protein